MFFFSCQSGVRLARLYLMTHNFEEVFALLCIATVEGCTISMALVCDVCDCVGLPCYVLGRVWYLILLIPDHCGLSYFL